MEPKFQTSFIPKRPVMDASRVAPSSVKTGNLYSTIATVLFVITLLVSGGLFAYKYYLIQQIVDADKALNDARAAFESGKINDLLQASTRISTTKTLLENHFVVSELLVLLEQLTVKNTKIDDFTYKNTNNIISIAFSGESHSYNALAQQSDLFDKSGFLKSQTFSDFSLTDTGSVKFKYSASLLPELISYKKVIDLLSTQ